MYNNVQIPMQLEVPAFRLNVMTTNAGVNIYSVGLLKDNCG